MCSPHSPAGFPRTTETPLFAMTVTGTGTGTGGTGSKHVRSGCPITDYNIALRAARRQDERRIYLLLPRFSTACFRQRVRPAYCSIVMFFCSPIFPLSPPRSFSTRFFSSLFGSARPFCVHPGAHLAALGHLVECTSPHNMPCHCGHICIVWRHLAYHRVLCPVP